jgi:hypothetical protein
MLRLIVLGTAVSIDLEMLLAEIIFAVVAFEGQEIEEVARWVCALLSDSKKSGVAWLCRHG